MFSAGLWFPSISYRAKYHAGTLFSPGGFRHESTFYYIEEQSERTLDMKHFHVVFTLPAELRPLARFAPRVVFDALLRAVGRRLLEFGDRNLDSTLGITLVLHTWTRELDFHPHAHAIVSAGPSTRSERSRCSAL